MLKSVTEPLSYVIDTLTVAAGGQGNIATGDAKFRHKNAHWGEHKLGLQEILHELKRRPPEVLKDLCC